MKLIEFKGISLCGDSFCVLKSDLMMLFIYMIHTLKLIERRKIDESRDPEGIHGNSTIYNYILFDYFCYRTPVFYKFILFNESRNCSK
jgi:hypothetical protein